MGIVKTKHILKIINRGKEMTREELERIREECKKHGICVDCKVFKDNNDGQCIYRKMSDKDIPAYWESSDIESLVSG